MTRKTILTIAAVGLLSAQTLMAQMPKYMMTPASSKPAPSTPTTPTIPMRDMAPTATTSGTASKIMEGTETVRPIDKLIIAGTQSPALTNISSRETEGMQDTVSTPHKPVDLKEESSWQARLNAVRLMTPAHRLAYLRDQQPGVRWELFARMKDSELQSIATQDLQAHINKPTHAVLYLQLVHDKFVKARTIEKITVDHAKRQRFHKSSESFFGSNHHPVEDMRPTRF